MIFTMCPSKSYSTSVDELVHGEKLSIRCETSVCQRHADRHINLNLFLTNPRRRADLVTKSFLSPLKLVVSLSNHPLNPKELSSMLVYDSRLG